MKIQNVHFSMSKFFNLVLNELKEKKSKIWEFQSQMD